MIGSALLGQMVFSVLMFIVSLFGLLEFHRLWLSKSSFRPNQFLSIIIGMMVYTSLALNAAGIFPAVFLLLNIPLLFILFIAELWRAREHPFVNIGLSLAGIIYIPFSLGLSIYFFDPLNPSGSMHYGTMIGFLFILWLNDTGAYLFGSWLGKNKLFPRISPGKSWEGSLGGVVIALFTAYGLSFLFPIFPEWKWLIMGMIIVVTGTVGDLVESMMKRSLGVKDSGNLLPGHGGILDRFDAFLMAVPFVFVFLTLVS
jgi:phosphatidate cytidylyltransferase